MGGIAQKIFGKSQPTPESEGTGGAGEYTGGSTGFGAGDDEGFGGSGSQSAVDSYQASGTGTQPSGGTLDDFTQEESVQSGGDDGGDLDDDVIG